MPWVTLDPGRTLSEPTTTINARRAVPDRAAEEGRTLVDIPEARRDMRLAELDYRTRAAEVPVGRH